jgi:hypothetical protein
MKMIVKMMVDMIMAMDIRMDTFKSIIMGNDMQKSTKKIIHTVMVIVMDMGMVVLMKMTF